MCRWRKWSNPDSHTQKHTHKREESDVVRNKSLASLLRLNTVRAGVKSKTGESAEGEKHRERERECVCARVCVKKCVRDPGKNVICLDWNTGLRAYEHRPEEGQ